jgi:hypothetical protein
MRRNRKPKQEEEDIRYLMCSNHGINDEKLPWSIVCIHLLMGPPQPWLAIYSYDKPEMGLERIPDFVCPSCNEDWERIMEEVDLTHLRPVCIKCLHKKRLNLDTNYHP